MDCVRRIYRGRYGASYLWTSFPTLVIHYIVLHHNSLSALEYTQESLEWVCPPPNHQARADRQGESTQTQQTAPYAKWPLAASSVTTTNHYLITADTSEKDQNIWNLSCPGPPSGTPGSANFYQLPALSSD